MMHAEPLVFLITAVVLVPGHYLGDYGLQTDGQANDKGLCGHRGRRACAGHVASLTLAQLVMLALVAVVTGTAMDPVAAALGLGVNAASHYWADRRKTLRGLILATDRWSSKIGFFDNGGAERVDQAWHMVWIVPAALVAASPVPLALALTIAAAAVLAVCDIASRRARRAEQAQDRAASVV